MGFIIGPIIAALLLTLLDIYSTEFKAELEFAEDHYEDIAVVEVKEIKDVESEKNLVDKQVDRN